ncbi:hypothetical protein IDM30_15490 [Acinetobacter seifertii]|nr:hypothetical protein [Acinetobacter seifertii]
MNIIDTSKIVDNAYVMYGNGGLGFNADYYAAGPYKISPSTVYKRRVIFLSNLRFMTKKWLNIWSSLTR